MSLGADGVLAWCFESPLYIGSVLKIALFVSDNGIYRDKRGQATLSPTEAFV